MVAVGFAWFLGSARRSERSIPNDRDRAGRARPRRLHPPALRVPVAGTSKASGHGGSSSPHIPVALLATWWASRGPDSGRRLRRVVRRTRSSSSTATLRKRCGSFGNLVGARLHARRRSRSGEAVARGHGAGATRARAGVRRRLAERAARRAEPRARPGHRLLHRRRDARDPLLRVGPFLFLAGLLRTRLARSARRSSCRRHRRGSRTRRRKPGSAAR